MMKKRFLALLLALCLAAPLAGCSSQKDPAQSGDTSVSTGEPNESTGDTTAPDSAPDDTTATGTESGAQAGEDAIDTIPLGGILDMMKSDSGSELGGFFDSYPVTADIAANTLGYNNFAGSFQEALGFGPMIGSIAFQMVLFRLEDGQDASAFADDIREGANPSKWVCVEADTVKTAVRGRTVLFIMGSADDVNPLYDAFVNLDASKFDASAYEKDNPLLNKNSSDVYAEAKSKLSFLFGKHSVDVLSADNAAALGMNVIDLSDIDNMIMEYDDTGDTPFFFGVFQMTQNANENWFMHQVAAEIEIEQWGGEDAVSTVYSSGKTVAVLVTASATYAADFASFMSETYGMTLYTPSF